MTCPEITEWHPLRPEDLVAAHRTHRSPATSSPPSTPTAGTTPAAPTRSGRTRIEQTSIRVGHDSLWQLDDTLYRQPVDGITGRGNTHVLKRQAILLGSTYAQRWCAVVDDETQERLIDLNRGQHGPWLPSRLYPDILTFAEAHGLQVHGSRLIKDLLRRGFWQHLHHEGEACDSERAA